MSGRFFADWQIGERLEPLVFAVTPTAIVASALATRDYSPLHHDERYAREQAGLPGIFLNSPAIQALIGRFLTERLGPLARLGRLRIVLQGAVHAGVSATIAATVIDLTRDAAGGGWAEVSVELHADERCCVQATARIALPVDPQDDPWQRAAGDWQP